MGMKKKELTFIMALVLGFLLPPALFGQWWLFGVFMLFFFCFGIVEWIAVAKTGESVSQKFWRMPSKTGKIVIVSGMIIAWAALILHFLQVL